MIFVFISVFRCYFRHPVIPPVSSFSKDNSLDYEKSPSKLILHPLCKAVLTFLQRRTRFANKTRDIRGISR